MVSHEGEGVLLRVDNVSVFASLSGFFLFGVQLGILGVLGARWIRVVAAAQQVQMASSIAGGLGEEEENTKDMQTSANIHNPSYAKPT